MSNLKPINIWTIEKDREWYGLSTDRFPAGAVVHVTEKYSGGEDIKTCEILGIEIREDRHSGNIIGHQYTHRELYRVKTDLGHETVMWPDEVEVPNE